MHISVIGAGKVGSALSVALKNAGYDIARVMSRSRSSAEKLQELVGAQLVYDYDDLVSPADIVLITTSDEAIKEVAGQLAEYCRAAGVNLSGKCFFHASGALSSHALVQLRNEGAFVGSMHPLQTFPSVEAAVSALPGAFFAIEGDEQALNAAIAMVEGVGASWFRIEPEAKALYHAAACVASNYLVSIFDAAIKLYLEIGVPPEKARAALLPLVKATVENLGKTDPPSALTGPIARGDISTIAAHIAAFEARENLHQIESLYKTLGGYTIDVALRKREYPAETIKQMRDILSH